MKIRIKDNSVRFRLTQSEVAALAENGVIKSHTGFLTQTFTYTLERTDSEDLSADFVENSIVMKIPNEFLEEWINTDRVGFSGQIGEVALLLEKDFVCIDNTVEDQTDNYPNPNLKC